MSESPSLQSIFSSLNCQYSKQQLVYKETNFICLIKVLTGTVCEQDRLFSYWFHLPQISRHHSKYVNTECSRLPDNLLIQVIFTNRPQSARISDS
ncbi:uncharacterized protein LOC129776434 isoform X4 [Toxorhynchites rutilus septentrionalis]|uniref:uncharacterized protein LOC129769280 isoform X4 n=1 Tax=Toxorhynchites rutilus septentrionalis TaxID=329112 RepID=UPI00247A8F81|nr:uncharacterized protein LOC129769280 isoform X4 [Toxorhynchites rutilus septentrionalis]XP_055630053.1 uncharacterized protein LOC129770901 isoform X4 [Toxorhynchites rutilus septentrionalis]XP_055638061.1 uncharacterized protein LOC129776434 isoform X4 [Toxorhynchites rutilus septentrionalis]